VHIEEALTAAIIIHQSEAFITFLDIRKPIRNITTSVADIPKARVAPRRTALLSSPVPEGDVGVDAMVVVASRGALRNLTAKTVVHESLSSSKSSTSMGRRMWAYIAL
jgi:hypothetical protein